MIKDKKLKETAEGKDELDLYLNNEEWAYRRLEKIVNDGIAKKWSKRAITFGVAREIYNLKDAFGRLPTTRQERLEIAKDFVDSLWEDDELTEDTVKLKDGKWTNKGKEGTHGIFKTKKAADAQRKAMFAQGWEESLSEGTGDIEDDVDITSTSNDNTPSGDALAIADDLVYAIKDEWDTVTLYNNIISELEEASKDGQNFDDIIPVIKDIVKEENVHIGQLQKALSTISPDTDDIANGEVEAEGQLTEDLDCSSDDISDWDFASQLEPYADDSFEFTYKDDLDVDYPKGHRRKTPWEASKRRDAMERSTQLKERKGSRPNAEYILDAWNNGYLKDSDLITYFLDKTPDDMLAELKISVANAKKNFDTETTADDLSFADVNTVLSDPNEKFLIEDTTSMNVSVDAESPATIKAEVKMDSEADTAVDTFDVVGNPEEDDLSIEDVDLV